MSTAQAINAGNPTAEQLAAFHAAQADFRHESSLDALYLVIIGVGTFVMTYVYMIIVSLPSASKDCWSP